MRQQAQVLKSGTWAFLEGCYSASHTWPGCFPPWLEGVSVACLYPWTSHTIPRTWAGIPTVTMKSLANSRAQGLARPKADGLETSLSLPETAQPPWLWLRVLCVYLLVWPVHSRGLGHGGVGTWAVSGQKERELRGLGLRNGLCRVHEDCVSVHLSGQREQSFHQILRRGFHLQGLRNSALGSALTPFSGFPSPNQPFTRVHSAPGQGQGGAVRRCWSMRLPVI